MCAEALAPFVPSADDPFDRRKAAHLLRRAGFGAPAAEIDQAVKQGLEATVEGLFEEAPGDERHFHDAFEAIRDGLLDASDADTQRAWWLYRMVRSRVPLREKLTLFWHGHFATSAEKVESLELMHLQIATFREHAWGNLRDLLQAVARDPAMLVWLDGQSNTREHPNENFARELMELFTCGIGHYTERDVQEAARAFTGWHRERARFAFDADAHDSGRKTFLGRSGKLDGGDIIDILVQEPATLTFLARKLLRFFAAPEPPDAVVAEAAAFLDRTQLDVKWFLRTLFQSRWFFSAECYRTRISSPVEFVVGSVRTLGARWAATALVEPLAGMGQVLLAPPNVKGWDGERKWINSSTWAARVSFAKTIAGLESDDDFGANLPIDALLERAGGDPAKSVDAVAALLLQGELPETTRRQLTELLVTNGDGSRNPETFRDDEDFRAQKLREAVGIVLSLPEYHMY